MAYLGSWKIDDLLTFPANTHSASTGAATDADSVPAYRVYEDETGTAILTGSMAKLDDANTTGFYSEQITLSAANGFEKGKCYTIYISAAVSSTSGTMSHTFQIEAEVDANTVSGPVTPAAGSITASVIATNAIDADALATDAISEIADGVCDEALSGHQSLGTVGRSITLAASILSETTTSGTPTSTIIPLTSGSAVDDFYNDLQLVITSGALAGQARTILDYDGGTTTVTVDEAFTSAPAAGVSVLIRATHTHPISQIISAIFGEVGITGGVADASPLITDFTAAAGLSSTDDFYNGCTLVFTSGTLKGIARRVIDYTGLSRSFDFTGQEWPVAPADNDTFIIIGRIEA